MFKKINIWIPRSQTALEFTQWCFNAHLSHWSLTWEFNTSSKSTQRGSWRIFALSMSFFSNAKRLSWIRHMPAWLEEPPSSVHKDRTSCGVVAFSTRISSSVRVNVMLGSSACAGPALRLRGLMEGTIRDWDLGAYSVSGWAVSAWRRLGAEEAWGHTARARAHRLKNLLAIWGDFQQSNRLARNPDLASTYRSSSYNRKCSNEIKRKRKKQVKD